MADIGGICNYSGLLFWWMNRLFLKLTSQVEVNRMAPLNSHVCIVYLLYSFTSTCSVQKHISKIQLGKWALEQNNNSNIDVPNCLFSVDILKC